MDETAPAPHARLAAGLLAGVIFVGSLVFWTIVPVGWLYLTGALVGHGGARFVMVIFGVPLSMTLMFMGLSRVEAYRRRILSPSGEPSALLEVMLVVSAVIAFVGLVLWWAFLADAVNPSGPLQPI